MAPSPSSRRSPSASPSPPARTSPPPPGSMPSDRPGPSRPRSASPFSSPFKRSRSSPPRGRSSERSSPPRRATSLPHSPGFSDFCADSDLAVAASDPPVAESDMAVVESVPPVAETDPLEELDHGPVLTRTKSVHNIIQLFHGYFPPPNIEHLKPVMMNLVWKSFLPDGFDDNSLPIESWIEGFEKYLLIVPEPSPYPDVTPGQFVRNRGPLVEMNRFKEVKIEADRNEPIHVVSFQLGRFVMRKKELRVPKYLENVESKEGKLFAHHCKSLAAGLYMLNVCGDRLIKLETVIGLLFPFTNPSGDDGILKNRRKVVAAHINSVDPAMLGGFRVRRFEDNAKKVFFQIVWPRLEDQDQPDPLPSVLPGSTIHDIVQLFHQYFPPPNLERLKPVTMTLVWKTFLPDEFGDDSLMTDSWIEGFEKYLSIVPESSPYPELTPGQFIWDRGPHMEVSFKEVKIEADRNEPIRVVPFQPGKFVTRMRELWVPKYLENIRSKKGKLFADHCKRLAAGLYILNVRGDRLIKLETVIGLLFPLQDPYIDHEILKKNRNEVGMYVNCVEPALLGGFRVRRFEDDAKQVFFQIV